MNRRLLAAVLACLAAVAPVHAAHKSEPGTLGDLGTRAAPVDRAVAVEAEAGQAARSYEEFLRIPDTDPALRAQALRRLGDLRLAESETLRADQGAESPAAAEAAREAVAAYRQLLAEQPQVAGADAVLYQLARASESLGDTDGARAALDQLAARYPTGAHYGEAQFRRGEVFFSEGRYADAEQAYAAVQALGPTSEFYVQAVYKRGWALFKQSQDVESEAVFLTLLDTVLVHDGRVRSQSDLSRPEQELTSDALRALAITFASDEGPKTLEAALDRHGPAPYEARVYAALGDLYVEKERYQDAAEAYRAYASRRPMDDEAPLMIVRATDAYARGGFASLVLDGKRQLVEQYGPGSEYWRVHADDLNPAVSSAVQASLLDLAQYHHALAQKGSAADRDVAVRWYRAYLEGFDSSPAAPATRLLLADLLFEGARYDEAAPEYERAAYSYPTNPESARAGYAALVAWDKAAAAAPEAARAPLEAREIDSSLRFAAAFPDHPETPAVLTRTTKTLFDAGDRLRAESVAQQVLALGPRATPEQQRVAWTVLAHTWFDDGRYADAEHAYAELASRIPAGDPQAGEISERLAASVYRQGEAKQQAGDPAGAVQDFLRVATVAPTSPAAAKGQYDAATLLIASKDWTGAAQVLERFRADYPNDELQPEVTRKLAVVYQEGGRGHDAAVELERIAARDAEPADVRRAALWQAAELYAASSDAAGATRAYTAYVARFPTPVDAAIEARQELALLSSSAGNQAETTHWLEEIVAADAAAGASRTDRTRFLAAQASLQLAQPLDAAARAVALTAPLDRSLARRKTAMEAALAAWSRAADYGVAGVTTEATWAMADLYRDFGAALLASQRPAGLSAEELEQYDLLLEEQAYPFEEKAIGIHATNAHRAATGTWDEWVIKSYSALAQMKPARYQRQERLDAADAAPGTPPEALASIAAALASLEQGKDDAAIEQAQAALALDPANAVARNLQGVAYRRSGRFAEAQAAYEAAIAGSPGHPTPERNLGILLDLYLDDPAAALPHYERYQQLTGGSDPETGPWLVELRTRIGQVQRTAETQP
ncbi:MAG: tetratricopeptide repeat protein [Steroidobacteraceae bacterium]